MQVNLFYNNINIENININVVNIALTNLITLISNGNGQINIHQVRQFCEHIDLQAALWTSCGAL